MLCKSSSCTNKRVMKLLSGSAVHMLPIKRVVKKAGCNGRKLWSALIEYARFSQRNNLVRKGLELQNGGRDHKIT
eukprot:1901919-Amphidinium_carterae.1